MPAHPSDHLTVRRDRRTLLVLASLLAVPLTPDGERPSGHASRVAPAGGLPPAVSVTPDGGTLNSTAHASGLSVQFVVKNNLGTGSTYNLSCSVTGELSGCSVQSSVYLPGNTQDEIDVTFSTDDIAASGNVLTLTATGTGTDNGTVNVAVDTSAVRMITPGGMINDSKFTVYRRNPVILARFKNGAGFATDSTQTLMTWEGRWAGGHLDTVTAEARKNRGLIEWEVDSARSFPSPGDSARLVIRQCTVTGSCTVESRYVKLAAATDSLPLIGFSAVPLEGLGSGVAAPFGPGFAVVGAEVETQFALQPYFTRGTARTTGLVYATRQAYPRVTVPVDIELPWLSANPDTMWVELRDGLTLVGSAVHAAPSCLTGAVRKCRSVVTADFQGSSFATPARKWLKVEVRVKKGTAVKSAVDSVEVALVDRRTTRYGAGWWPAPGLRLVGAGEDRLLVGASGTVSVFRGNGDSLYLPPLGATTVLRKVAAGWELSPRGGVSKLTFDLQGRLTASIDGNGNADSILYGGTGDSILAVKDPTGRSITFTYSSGKLSKLTSLSGASARDHFVSVNGTTNLLEKDSIGGTRFRTRYGYHTVASGTKTYLINSRAGLVGDTTFILYDSSLAQFRRRPHQARLPRVKTPAGADTTPRLTWLPLERAGAATVAPLDSSAMTVEVRDPAGLWSRSVVTRWGQPRLTWDTLGVLGRAAYAGDGRTLWAEGQKSGDTTRVNFSYDSLGRLVKRWIRRVERSPVDTLRLDSLVYDASHRVIRRIDPTGKVDSLWYDASSNLTKVKGPGGDTTKYTYYVSGAAKGLVASTVDPGNGLVSYTYDPALGNLLYVYLGNGNELVGIHSYDSLGRTLTSEARIRTRVTASQTKWQWRRTSQTYSTPLNLIAGGTSARTDNCDDPCDTPPAYGSDTAHVRSVTFALSTAGRDSIRSNERGQQTVYTFDRLGRLIRRQGPNGSRDSMVYDVAGTLQRTITRRNDTIVLGYDLRYRDTSAVIPGVGTLRKAYGGPAGQLSQMWYASPVDSIGGVSGGVGFRYDARGRVLTDTSYAGAVAQVTSFTYDAFERDSIVQDPLGQWKVRYDPTRGHPARIETPFGDSTTYAVIKGGRIASRITRTPGQPAFSQMLDYTGNGRLAVMTTSAGSTGWNAGSYDPEWTTSDTTVGPPLGPLWSEQHGPSVAPDSSVDSLSFDGWGRLVGWRQYRKTPPASSFQPFASDSFGFDATGNLRVIGETRWHDPVTDRLDSLVRGSSTFRYTYDPAGNLTQSAETGPGGTLTWKYGYDALNRLRAVRYRGAGWGADSLVARYAYDVLGRRIAKRVYWSPVAGAGARYQRYVYHGDQVAFETDSSGTMTSKYSWAPGVDNLLGFTDSTGTYYNVVTDHLGSVRGLVRRDGTWMMHQRFTPYGTRLARDSTGALPTLRYGWTGREHDAESGLVYFRARYYDPGQRRFTQEDPIGHAGGLNVYGYVGGQPLSARDPSGLSYRCAPYWLHTWWQQENPPYKTSGHQWFFLGIRCTGHDDLPSDVVDGGAGPGGAGPGGGGPGGPSAPAPGQPPTPPTPRPPEENPEEEKCEEFRRNKNLRGIIDRLRGYDNGLEMSIATDANFTPLDDVRTGNPGESGYSPDRPSFFPPSETQWIVHTHPSQLGLSGYDEYGAPDLGRGKNKLGPYGDYLFANNHASWPIRLQGVIAVTDTKVFIGRNDGSNQIECSF